MLNAIWAVGQFVLNLFKNPIYALQVIAALALIAVNYATGPFLSDVAIVGIATALAIPEPLWKLLADAMARWKQRR